MPVHKHTLAAAGAVFSAFFGAAASAQDNATAIEQCAGIEAADARIRCLEEAIRRMSSAPAEAVTPDRVQPAREERTEQAAVATPAESPDLAAPPKPEPEPASAPQPGVASASTPEVRTATGSASAPADPGPVEQPSTDSAESALDRMGTEQLPVDKAEDDLVDVRIPATVVAFDFVGRNKLRMRLENGQVWRQIDADRGDFYPMLRGTDSFEIELWQTSLGGYRIRLLPTNRTARVRRVQ
ncbi:MAG: hypothetical protein OEW35_11145 [Gammaproteobacteria bacterium]|nr:hypothetical protein [Gammaproteobacteria bacterium]MDH4254335.1 hypothetical protein [Gammaproteobacteria bacterium]MDH5309613.1 hypothetical protein [Gammaproteobacteria bacterium]